MPRLPHHALRPVLIAVLSLASCGGPASPGASSPLPAAVTVSLLDDGCELAGPAEAAAGTVVFELENRSNGQFAADLWRLNPGHGYDELATHIAEEQRRADAGEPGLGHPTFATLVDEETVTAERGSMTSTVSPGIYGVACIKFESGLPVRIWAAGPITIGG